MRILIVTRFNSVAGGVETYLRRLVPVLRGRGHAVAVAYEYEAPDPPVIDPESRPGEWWLGAPDTMRRAETWKPDVAYIHGLFGADLENALLDRFPSVAYVHNYATTCISGSKARYLPNLRPCGRTLGPACLAMYLPCRCGGLNPVTMVRAYGAAIRSLQALKRYRLVLVASAHMGEECRKNGVDADRVRVAALFPHAAVDGGSVPEPRGRPGTRVLLMGRLTAVKGGAELVEALAAAGRALGRGLHLDVIGDGPERGRIASRAHQRGVAAKFYGWVDRAPLGALTAEADVLAVPSLWPEPFGVVGIEAGSIGVPAVAFANGGIPSWLRPGVSGELAPLPPTVGGLADALCRALRDPAHLDALRLGAWHAAREFTLEAHVDQVEAALVDGMRLHRAS